MMSGLPHGSGHRRRPTRAALTAAFAVVAAGASVVAPSAAQAATTTLYASPTGSGTSCTSAAPCSLTQARSSVEAIDTNMSGDIVVQLAGGTYRLTSPLSLGSADSGTNGHTVYWQAASGQTPVISGGQRSPAGPCTTRRTTSTPPRCPPGPTRGSCSSTARSLRA